MLVTGSPSDLRRGGLRPEQKANDFLQKEMRSHVYTYAHVHKYMRRCHLSSIYHLSSIDHHLSIIIYLFIYLKS